MTPLERAQKSLSGLWMGDCFGGSFFWKQGLQQLVLARRLAQGEWRWSDDTAMGLSVVRCLRDHECIEREELARLFAEEYHREPTRGYGTMAHTYLHELGRGVPWQQAAQAVFEGGGSYGNGAAMRAGPVGAYFSGDMKRVVEEARKSAMVTHAHPEGQAGAVAVAVAAAWAAENVLAEGGLMLEQVLAHTPAGETRDALLSAFEFPRNRTPGEAAALLGAGEKITSQDTVPYSLWCAARHPDSFHEALWATVAGGGDMDTTCAIVGSVVILSARDGIPQDWVQRAESLK